MLAAHCDVQCLRLDFPKMLAPMGYNQVQSRSDDDMRYTERESRTNAGVVLVVTHILAKDKLRVRFPSPAPNILNLYYV